MIIILLEFFYYEAYCCLTRLYFTPKKIGLYALSSFASSCEGALALVMTDVTLLETWFSLLSSGKIEILTAALHSIARVLDTKSNSLEVGQGSSESKASSTTADGDVTSSVDLAALKKKIVSEIGKTKGVSAVTFLMKTARQPVNERKLAVYATMTALCRQQPGGWGLMAMYSTQGFREFIEDRDTEHTKEGKEAKFRSAIFEAPLSP